MSQDDPKPQKETTEPGILPRRPFKQLLDLFRWVIEYTFTTENFVNVIAMMIVFVAVYKEIKSLPIDENFMGLVFLVLGYYFRRTQEKILNGINGSKNVE